MPKEISEIDGWQRRLALIVDAMQDLSRHSDPQEMVRAYGERIRQIVPSHRRLSLSRRGLASPHYRITRSTTWSEEINPWKDKVFYTDGITEAHSPTGELFGTSRLDTVLEQCSLEAAALLDSVLQSVKEFADGRPILDDQTIIIARVVGESGIRD
jgi:hypothetical protein